MTSKVSGDVGTRPLKERLHLAFEGIRAGRQGSDPISDGISGLYDSKGRKAEHKIAVFCKLSDIRVRGWWRETGEFEVDRVLISTPNPSPGLPRITYVFKIE